MIQQDRTFFPWVIGWNRLSLAIKDCISEILNLKSMSSLLHQIAAFGPGVDTAVLIGLVESTFIALIMTMNSASLLFFLD
jgi:hypothetical protein